MKHPEVAKNSDSKPLGLSKLSSHKSTRSLLHGLKAGSGRADAPPRPDSVHSHSTKNQNYYHTSSQGQFKNRLQSKYGISAQNKLFGTNGAIKPQSTKNQNNSANKSQYLSTLNNYTKAKQSRNSQHSNMPGDTKETI